MESLEEKVEENILVNKEGTKYADLLQLSDPAALQERLKSLLQSKNKAIMEPIADEVESSQWAGEVVANDIVGV